MNEDEGVHYLVLEYVAGTNLAEWMLNRGPIEEGTSLAILADVARALESAHELRIVHRDIKPENILVVHDPIEIPRQKPDLAPHPRVKLSSFGLARGMWWRSESLILTRDGAVLWDSALHGSGTVCGGACKDRPEGGRLCDGGDPVQPCSAGRPCRSRGLSADRDGQAPDRAHPRPQGLVPSVSDAAVSIVARAMSKLPGHRYADAREILRDLERLLRGEPTGLELHPRLPEGDPGDVVTFDWRWDLESSPRALWPLVSNTERFNRAIGLSAVRFDDEVDPDGGSKRSGKLRKAGVEFAWREHPFEWVEGRRMGVFREFGQGPFQWFVSVVELSAKSGGGTSLTHQVKIKPRGIVGRTIAAVEIGTRGRKSIDRVYRRIDATLTGKLGRDPIIDPYEAPEPLSGERRRRLERWLDTLGARGFDPQVVERIGDFLELAPAQEVARIRPLALARQLAIGPDAVVDACFRGASDGVLMLLWDILCPVCRIPSQVMDTLRALKDHGHCESCNLDYEFRFLPTRSR